MTLNRELLNYWPREADVAACVKTEAEASHQAVLLAVHQPMRFDRRVIGGGAVLEACDEHDLLRAFLAQPLPEGRVIVPIVGSSGTGKSHVIRWLDAQVRRMPDNDSRVIIRIPKGMSLKGVLGILLNALPSSAYDSFRQELGRAQEDLEPEGAAGLLCEMLAQKIAEMGADARTQLLRNPGDKSAQEIDAFCRAEMLPALLRNQLLRDQHFVRTRAGGPGVVKRLVEQLTEDRDPTDADDRQHVFTPADLKFDTAIDRDALGRQELRALSQFDRDDRRTTAARILNEALDDAKQGLLHLDPTVSDLFDAVRSELLKEQRELVLLVEDFAVLSGLQKQILQVIIKEAYRDGRQVLCTMRTALAYTTGYMTTATVLTRANVEYIIPDEPGYEEDMLARIERLVGAYLNAARIGQSQLERAYVANRPEARELRKWIPSFSSEVEPATRTMLDSFGRSSDGYELFPFNQAAIRELSREGSRQAGRLVYNPRFVIQNVINKVLDHRHLFAQSEFPPADFSGHGRPLPARVAEDIRRRVPPRSLERYIKVLTYWGGFPGSLAEVTEIDPRLFEAFGLERIADGRDSPDVARPIPATASRKVERKEEAGGDRRDASPLEAKWENIFEGWRAGAMLLQADANQLRKWIAEALERFVDWDWGLYRPRPDAGLESWYSWIFIPQAAGNEGRTADEAMVAVCSDTDLADQTRSATVQSALMALVRFQSVHGNSWDYPDADDDMPKYSAFLERLAGRAREFARRRHFKADWDPVPSLVDGLLIGARALGIATAMDDNAHASLLHSLFERAPTPHGPPAPVDETDASRWGQFVEILRQCRRTAEHDARDRSTWQDHLLELVGARQGQADLVHAIDVTRLKPAIERTTESWEFREALPSQPGVLALTTLRNAYGDLKRLSSSIAKAQQRLFRWRAQTIKWLGEGFDQEALATGARETVETAMAAGLTVGMDARRVLDLLEEFRKADVTRALEHTGLLADGASRAQVLAALGSGPEAVVRVCQNLEVALDALLDGVEAELVAETRKYGSDPVAEAKAILVDELRMIGSYIQKSKPS